MKHEQSKMLTLVAIILVFAQGTAANLLCSGNDKTCQASLEDHRFYAAQTPGAFSIDFFAKNASTIIPPKFPDSGIKVTYASMDEKPMLQLPQFNFVNLYWWMPPGSVSAPHFHANSVEWGFMTKGSAFVCQYDFSKAASGVGFAPKTAPMRFFCNKYKKGQMYMVPPGWVHFVLFPCEKTELVFGFSTTVDYNNVNSVNIVDIKFPRNKMEAGKGVSLNMMEDMLKLVGVSVKDYEHGDSHLYMLNKDRTKQFCNKYY